MFMFILHFVSHCVVLKLYFILQLHDYFSVFVLIPLVTVIKSHYTLLPALKTIQETK